MCPIPVDPVSPIAGIKPTPEEVIAEGQIKVEYFPLLESEVEFLSHISSRVDDVDADVQLRIDSAYATSGDMVKMQLKKAEIYLTLSRLWQQIKAVMDSYDDEHLPAEFVDPEQAAANRDWYAEQAELILVRYDPTPVDEKKPFAKPVFTVG
jgi:hypothetical protein